jgi:hypothetical protein
MTFLAATSLVFEGKAVRDLSVDSPPGTRYPGTLKGIDDGAFAPRPASRAA